MIGACDICDRQNVPISHFHATVAHPETSACFICQGEDDPDPYGETKESIMKNCDCGAPTEGKWADIHHSNCPALLTPTENELIERALDRRPDWPPQVSAIGLPNGERRHGSTGQLFEVKDGCWQRVIAR